MKLLLHATVTLRICLAGAAIAAVSCGPIPAGPNPLDFPGDQTRTVDEIHADHMDIILRPYRTGGF